MEKKLKSSKNIPESGRTGSNVTEKDAERFLKLRKSYGLKNKKNYSQKDFAKLLGISAGKVSELESSKKEPSLQEALAYNHLTGASLEYLFGVTTKSSENTGLNNKALDNLQRMKKQSNSDNAFKALNHLLSSPDAIQFLNMLHLLWFSPLYNAMEIFNPDFSKGRLGEISKELFNTDSSLFAYAVKAGVERSLLTYLDNHGFYDKEEYDKLQQRPSSGDDIPNMDLDDLVDQ